MIKKEKNQPKHTKDWERTKMYFDDLEPPQEETLSKEAAAKKKLEDELFGVYEEKLAKVNKEIEAIDLKPEHTKENVEEFERYQGLLDKKEKIHKEFLDYLNGIKEYI